MGRILEYVVLISNLSLVLGAQQYLKPSQATNYEREKQGNLTQAVKQYFPEDQNGFFNRKVLPSELQGRKKVPPSKQMLTSVGLHAYASDDSGRDARKRNFFDRRNVLPAFSQSLYPRRNSKNFYNADLSSQKVSHNNNSFSYQTKRTEDLNRRYQREGRHARYHPRHSAKICDPCNSVPWVPLLKVSDSYRQQRTHVTELHPTPQQNFNFDYHPYASNTHNILLPPVPLPPPIFDGTISSSFGLPIGNIPTSHGLLAPINHLATEFKYPINTIDYSNSFNYYSPPGLLDSNNFPELSPVPIVPIHDSAQFYHLDSTIPDLVPPPTKDVSNVVLTISEDQNPPNRLPHNHKNPDAVPSPQSSAHDIHLSHPPVKEQNRSKDLGRLEIVKSIPLAEFTSSVHFPQQQLPLYPPLQSEFSSEHEFHSKKTNSDHLASSLSFLVPPPPKKVENDISFSSNKSSDDKSEYLGQATAPKPLTSPSLSWLFSDHTAPPSDSKSTASVPSFATDGQEIASIVNNELRPVSSRPLVESSPSEQSVGVSKSKKIQIIIPYTTKSKNGHDNNALESVQHEVFQPPVIQSTNGNNSPRDSATSALPPSAEQPRPAGASRDRKVTDRSESQHKAKNERQDNGQGYFNEMRHIIATNLRELLREEIEKSQKDQNYPLQNNIDNWTALEYSNHKTVGTKAPKEIIAQALAVTSIPGTSISHLLLPSKKIPNEYFVTTPIPVYDEPNTAVYKAENSSVNSRPFTAKPYATTNVYNPTRGVKESLRHLPPSQVNHERNYTDVAVGRVNTWGRLNENLVLPEARSRTRTAEQTTASAWPGSPYSPSTGSEKVQIVTPVSVSSKANHTAAPFRRTTRHTRTTTETPTARKPFRKPLLLNRVNSTKLEKVSNLTSPFMGKSSYGSSTVRTGNSSHSVPGVEVKNNAVSVEESGVEAVTVGQEPSRLSGKGEHFSINDIFPFRNKELPWESGQNSSQPALRTARQRNSLIKQVNLQRPKAVVGSS